MGWKRKRTVCVCVTDFADINEQNGRTGVTKWRGGRWQPSNAKILQNTNSPNRMDQNYFALAGAKNVKMNKTALCFSQFQGVAFYIIISVLMVCSNDFGSLDLRLGFRSISDCVVSHCCLPQYRLVHLIWAFLKTVSSRFALKISICAFIFSLAFSFHFTWFYCGRFFCVPIISIVPMILVLC